MTLRILLVRHGQSTWNAEGRWQGRADPPLSPLGLLQARAAVDALGTVDDVIASPLVRALQTATILADALGIGPIATDARLVENDAGEWTGLTRAEIDARWPGWLAENRLAPGFESVASITERTLAAIADLHERQGGRGDVLVVSHGGLIRNLERTCGIDPAPVPNLAGRWFAVDGARLTPGERVVLVDHDRMSVPEGL
jgi:broad specificity phosphatase PhoE